MTVFVVIPWRPGCPYREAAFHYITQWWACTYPEWSIMVGPWWVERGPWRKGCAVRNAGVSPAPNDVVVVADADVIPIGISDAVEAVASGPGRPPWWAMPFRMVHRLSQEATRLVIAGQLALPISRQLMAGLVQESYVGTAGGGVVVLRGDVFRSVPIDPRFAGYGQEDMSWSQALHRLAGAPLMSHAPLWHLWHPPQDRMSRGSTVSRGIGSEAGLRLWQRYRQAATPALMRVLVAEAEVAFTDIMGDYGGSC